MGDREHPLLVVVKDYLPINSLLKSRSIYQELEWRPFVVRLAKIGEILTAVSVFLFIILYALVLFRGASEVPSIVFTFLTVLTIWGTMIYLTVKFVENPVQAVTDDEALPQISANGWKENAAVSFAATLMLIFAIFLRSVITRLPPVEVPPFTAYKVGQLIGYLIFDGIYFGLLLTTLSVLTLLVMDARSGS